MLITALFQNVLKTVIFLWKAINVPYNITDYSLFMLFSSKSRTASVYGKKYQTTPFHTWQTLLQINATLVSSNVTITYAIMKALAKSVV